MKATSVLAAVLLAGSILCTSVPASGDDLKSAIERACLGADTDADKAVKLVAAARESGVDDEIALGLLCAAAEAGIKAADTAEGLDAGIDALCELATRVPAKASYYRARLGLLCNVAHRRVKPEVQYAAAGEVKERIEAAGDKALAAGRWEDAKACYTIGLRMAGLGGRSVVSLENKIRCARHFAAAASKVRGLETASESGDKAAAGRLVMVYLIELDDPAGAEKLLTADSGEVLRTCVPLAAKDADGLPAGALRQLRDWYAKLLVGRSVDYAKELMLRRALLYARLSAGKSGPAPAAANADLVASLTKQLDAFTYVNRTLGRLPQLDLMPMVDIKRDGTKGRWRFAENSFIADGSDDGTLTFPVVVEGSYRLSLQIARNEDAEGISVSFPVGDKKAYLRLAEHTLMKEFRSNPDSPAVLGYLRVRRKRRGKGKRIGLSKAIEEAQGVFVLRTELHGLGKRDRPAAAKVITPQYEKHPWVPYTIDISVKVDGDKATVAVAVGSTHKVNWQGDTGDPGPSSTGRQAIAIRFKDSGVALRSASLTLHGGAARYAYEDRFARWQSTRPDKR